MLATLLIAAFTQIATAAKTPTAPAISSASHTPVAALRLSIQELKTKFGDKYPAGQSFLDQLATLEAQSAALAGDALKTAAWKARFDELQFKALVTDNPYIDFTEMLAVRRVTAAPKDDAPAPPEPPQGQNKKARKPKAAGGLGLPQNWQGNTSINPRIDNELVSFEIKTKAPAKTIYQPEEPWFVGDVKSPFQRGSLAVFLDQQEQPLAGLRVETRPVHTHRGDPRDLRGHRQLQRHLSA